LPDNVESSRVNCEYPNTIKTLTTTSPKTHYFPTLTFESVFSRIAIRAIGFEIGLECDGCNTYDGPPIIINRYFIIRSLNLLKILSRVVQLYLHNAQWA
jgi:hypothetical protein